MTRPAASDYANLDLLRSLAVFSVVTAHLWSTGASFALWQQNIPLKEFLHSLSLSGVAFFFVHTCLVLMLSMQRMPKKNFTRSFLIRRAFRIYPLCWTVILLVLMTGLTEMPAVSVSQEGWRGMLGNVLLVKNFLARDRVDIIGPLWSLHWEMQMYLLLPGIYLLLRRSAGIFGSIALWTSAMGLGVCAERLWSEDYQLGVIGALIKGLEMAPLFISGIVAFKLLSEPSQPKNRKAPAWLWPLFVLGLFAIDALMGGDRRIHAHAGMTTLIDAAICLALAFGIAAFRDLSAPWIVKPSQQIAKYSYGIYLVHIPAMVFVFRYIHKIPVSFRILTALVITAALAFVSFHAIENPLIRLGKRLTRPIANSPTAARTAA